MTTHSIHEQQYTNIHKSFDKAVKMGCLWSFLHFQRHIKNDQQRSALFIDEKWFLSTCLQSSNTFR